MKQAYLIGIVLALGILIVFGLAKAFKVDAPERADPVVDALNTYGEERQATSTEPPTTNPNTPSSMSTTTPDTASTPETMTSVTMQTNRGDITLELFTAELPITTQNFLKLARDGFYDGVKFHRVIDGFMIQGGDPLTKDDSAKARWGTGGPGYTIKDELLPTNANLRGTISMANAGPNTGGSQFFINTVDNTFLNPKHPAFGRVTSGMDVVDTISKTPTGQGDVPIDPVVITRITVN